MVSTTSSPVHKASLVDPATHSPAVLELIDIKVSRPVIDYCIEATIDTVDFAMGRPSSSKRGRPAHAPRHAAFATFAHNVITRAELTTATLLAALVYVDRARPHLHIALEEWACERVLLGALMLAAKYTNDSTLKNVHWALCTGVFGKRDVGRIEREFLDVLDWELALGEGDLLAHHEGLTAVARPASPRKHTHRARKHTAHARAGSAGSLPELEPSSPHSASSSSASPSPSPRTPETLISYADSDAEDDMDVDAYEAPRPAPRPHLPRASSHPAKKPQHSHQQGGSGSFSMSSVHDLLRSFPVPAHPRHPVRVAA